jgi:hypothetical protein
MSMGHTLLLVSKEGAVNDELMDKDFAVRLVCVDS